MGLLRLLAVGEDAQRHTVTLVQQRRVRGHAGFAGHLQRNRRGRERTQPVGRHFATGTRSERIAGTAAEFRTQRIEVSRGGQHLAVLVAQAQVHVQVRFDRTGLEIERGHRRTGRA